MTAITAFPSSSADSFDSDRFALAGQETGNLVGDPAAVLFANSLILMWGKPLLYR
jgi:hypothetical protein